jgi:hypothetical protein
MSHQQSDKHGPVADERLQDERRQVAAGTRHEGAPNEDPLGRPVPDMRSEIARCLGPHAFPGDAAALRAVAARNDAPPDVRAALDRLPDGEQYPTVEAVVDALGIPHAP